MVEHTLISCNVLKQYEAQLKLDILHKLCRVSSYHFWQVDFRSNLPDGASAEKKIKAKTETPYGGCQCFAPSVAFERGRVRLNKNDHFFNVSDALLDIAFN